MTDNIINSKNSQKMSVYCKTCVCRGCHTGQELYNQGMWHGMAIGSKEELDRLKAENDRLRNELATYGATGVCEVCSDKANKLADKYLGCLQEIKAVAEKTIDIYYPDYYDEGFEEDILTEFAKDILDLITKAGEE